MSEPCIECNLTPSQAYPNIKINGVTIKVHRLVWEQANGPIPKGMLICHTCDNRRCININHLFMGTPQDNMNDKVNKNRQHRGGPGQTLPVKVYQEIIALRYEGLTYEEIGIQYMVSRRTITRFLSRCPHD